MRIAGRGGWATIVLRAGLLAMALSGAASAGGTESQRFAAFLEAVYQQNLSNSPQLATECGSKAGNDRWDDLSEQALAAAAARVRTRIAKAKADFDFAKLDAASKVTRCCSTTSKAIRRAIASYRIR